MTAARNSMREAIHLFLGAALAPGVERSSTVRKRTGRRGARVSD